MSTRDEPDDRDEDDGVARAKRRGKSYALAIFVSFAAAFITLSTWEIVAGVFALDAPGGVAAHGKLSAGCAGPLRAFAATLDRKPAVAIASGAAGASGALGASGAAGGAVADGRSAAVALHDAAQGDRRASLAALDSVCSTESADLDALAAVKRFVRAGDAIGANGFGRQDRGDRDEADAIAPLRRDIEAYLTP